MKVHSKCRLGSFLYEAETLLNPLNLHIMPDESIRLIQILVTH